MTTWRKLIQYEMAIYGESFDNVIESISEVDGWLDLNFDNGYGIAKGPSFTLWTENRVYFPCEYDGSEFVSSVPRNPCNEIIRHNG